ncbi:O-antigen ligase family protein [Paenibacillus sp. TRM 82003]|nr:O-antigen ligase family protein [Paenibacillus sp. TRM 82003]
MLPILIYPFLLYASVYGFVSIYVDNIAIRAIKDFYLLFLALLGMAAVYNQKGTMHIRSQILLFTMGFSAIGLTGNLTMEGIVTYIYGLKITVLPLGMLYLGMLLKKLNEDYSKVCLIIYFAIIGAWVIQYNIGIPRLISDFGFVYGVHVRNFVDGTARYPSLVGGTDAYAFLLAILSVILERSRLFDGKPIMQNIFRINSLIFLFLSTTRSAVVLWLVCQFVFIVWGFLKKKQIRTLYLSGFFILIPLIGLLVTFAADGNGMFSNESLKARLVQWGQNVQPVLSAEGIAGQGLGEVGSASRRTADLGFESSLDFAADNEYLALYQQTGIVGFLLWSILMILILRRMLRNLQSNEYAITGVALLMATMVSCFFTNTIELYPFNIFLWVTIGASLIQGGDSQQDDRANTAF